MFGKPWARYMSGNECLLTEKIMIMKILLKSHEFTRKKYKMS